MRRSLLERIASALVGWLVRWFSLSSRFRIHDPHAALARLLAERRPAVLCFWHDTLFASAGFVHRELWRKKVPLVLLASPSKDGDFIADIARTFRVEIVRGSSSRGGVRALRELRRGMRERGLTAVVVPDGPRGPARRVKPGVAAVARMTAAAVVPVRVEIESYWRLKTWDRMRLPKPFSRVHVTIGEPVVVGADGLPVDEARVRIENDLGGGSR